MVSNVRQWPDVSYFRGNGMTQIKHDYVRRPPAVARMRPLVFIFAALAVLYGFMTFGWMIG